MGDRVYTAPANAGGLVTNFVEYGGRIWAASGDYLCRLSADCTSWDKEILCPTPIKLLVVVKQPHYRLIMTSAEEGNTALYELNASETGITMVCLSLGDEETRVTSIAALHVISEFNSDEEWVDAVYAVFSERAMVARWGWQEGWPVWYVTINYDAVGFSHYSSCTALRYDFPSVTTIYIAGSDGNYYHISGMGGEWVRIADGSTTEYPNPEDSLWVHHRDRIYLCDYYGRLYLLRTTLTGWDLAHESPPGYYHPKNIISYLGYLFLVTGDSSGDYENEAQMYILKNDGYFLSWYYAPRGLRPSIIYNGKLYYSSINNSSIMRYISLSNLEIEADTYNGEEPLTVNFTMGAESDFPVLSYHLHFGDDTVYHGLTPGVTHEYIRGTYTPILRISNGLDELTSSDAIFGNMIDAYDSSLTYQIYTVEDLQKIGLPGNKTLGIKAWPLHGYFLIMNDIDASETSSWDGGLGFYPRSRNPYFNAFTGTLDGNNHTISGMYINRPLEDNVGIISFANSCIIKNLTLENASVTGSGSVGIIAGHTSYDNVQSFVENCSIIGGVVADGDTLGGLVGLSYSTHFSNCYSSVTLVTTYSYAVGGIVGKANGMCEFDSCVYENDSVQDMGTSYNVGGIAGEVYFDYDLRGYIKNCTATANFIVSRRAGMLCGYVNSGVMQNNNVYGSLYIVVNAGRSTAQGTFIGECYTSDIENCHSYVTLEINPNISVESFGGFIGFHYGPGYCKKCSVRADILLGEGQYTYDVGGFVGYENVIDYEDCHAYGNIRTSGSGHTGGFVGSFYGGDLKYCSARGNFDIVAGGCSYTGGFGGYMSISGGNKVLSCYSKGNLTVTAPGGDVDNTGGLFGYYYNGNQGSITIATEACYSHGNITIEADYVYSVGGLIGSSNSDLYICDTYGNIECTSPYGDVYYVGGLCGYASGTLIERCYTRGNVKCTGRYIGGLIGSSSIAIRLSYASGSVEGYQFTGGFIGYHNNGLISDCYASGDVKCSDPYGYNIVGGFIGAMWDDVERVYSIGKVTIVSGDTDYVGGLVGETYYTATDSYWDIETSGLATSAAGIGRDSATMKALASYLNWNFSGIWLIKEGYSYPYFLYPPPPPGPIYLVQFSGNPLEGYIPVSVTFTDQTIW